jgi:hypothetical protein
MIHAIEQKSRKDILTDRELQENLRDPYNYMKATLECCEVQVMGRTINPSCEGRKSNR